MKRYLIALAAGALLLTGCGEGASLGNSPAAPIDGTVKVPISGDDDVLVVEFHLSDGTRCVVSDGYNSGGVDCDWDK